MKIGVVGGTGKEGSGLAMRWARAGHEVCVGSRDAERAGEKAREFSERSGATIGGADNRTACANADVVLLSVPFAGHGATLTDLRDALAGKIVIDITVPLKPPAVRTVHLPEGSAAALNAQHILGADARVVATLHHVSSVHLADLAHTIDCDVLLCGDDAEARTTVAALISDLGLRPVDCGKLANAVALESLTPVLLHINKHYKSAGAGLRITGI